MKALKATFGAFEGVVFFFFGRWDGAHLHFSLTRFSLSLCAGLFPQLLRFSTRNNLACESHITWPYAYRAVLMVCLSGLNWYPGRVWKSDPLFLLLKVKKKNTLIFFSLLLLIKKLKLY